MLVVLVLIFASCGGKKDTKTTTVEQQKVQETETVIIQEPEEPIIETPTIHHFTGKVAGSNVHVSMLIDGSNVVGRYYYDSQRKNGSKASMMFFGEKDDDKLKLTEFFTDHPTGQFDGEWIDRVYQGTFTRAKDGKTFDFELTETEGGEAFFAEEELVFDIPDFETDLELDFDELDIGFSDSGSADWDKVLDEYEKFVNSYISWVNKANKGSVSALAESAEMMEKAEKFSSKLESAKGDMSTAQMNRLLKLENKMAGVAIKAAGNMENMMDNIEDLDVEDLMNNATNGLFGDDDW